MIKVLWPIAALLFFAWLSPGLVFVYLLLGMIVKIGHLFFKDEHFGAGKEPVFHSGFGLVVEVYRILTWPAYFKDASIQTLIKITGATICVISVISGAFYYRGSEALVPQPVIEKYQIMLSNTEFSLSEPVKEEITSHIDTGFKYPDFLWAKAQILKSCGKEEQIESSFARFTSIMKAGIFSLKPGLTDSLIIVEHAKASQSCIH
ncbi:hypothetical protein P7F88_17915 [Vibrio hannami]|uniref:hypothetical protein n=1 Tax=Vibrio hannami TaxID=2717094 RepID=UPI00240FFAD5|nr:hypothetical protein [Vibrio hannami]MDG3087843.1 hypothetical protein [Vibrio hannami]